MREIRHFLAMLCLLVCLCSSLLAQRAEIATQSNIQTQYIDVGGYKLRLQVAGSGTPTVVLDCGFGDSLEVWNDVYLS